MSQLNMLCCRLLEFSLPHVFFVYYQEQFYYQYIKRKYSFCDQKIMYTYPYHLLHKFIK